MNNNHSVTLTISAEEFNRFQGDEKKLIELEEKNESLKTENRKVSTLQEENVNLRNSIRVLKSGERYIKLENVYFYMQSDGTRSYSTGQHRSRDNVYITEKTETFLKHSLIKVEETKLDKIPKWIRKIFGAI